LQYYRIYSNYRGEELHYYVISKITNSTQDAQLHEKSSSFTTGRRSLFTFSGKTGWLQAYLVQKGNGLDLHQNIGQARQHSYPDITQTDKE